MTPVKSAVAPRKPTTHSRSFEWPTWLVIAIIYGGWLLVTLTYRLLPVWFANLVLLLIATWQMSLQHELLHGHPTLSIASWVYFP